MKITLYQRNSNNTNFSIERLFSDIHSAIPDFIDAKMKICRFPSRGIFNLIYNLIEAIFFQGDVNHITGDVHYLAIVLQKKRTLLTIHDLVSLYRLKGFRKKVFFFFWYWLPIKCSSLVSVISESTKRDLLEHVKADPRKIRIVYNCISSDFQPSPKRFDTEKPVILQMGTRSNKNLDRVAQSLQGIPCHLRIIGRLSNAQIDKLMRCSIEFSSTSNITDAEILDEYRCCDMLLFVSTYEGFGLPIIEAQATGRPVITGNILSMPEVAGDAACLVDPFDISVIREGVLRIIQDSNYRNELIRRGFANVKRFRKEEIARQYVEIYKELYQMQK